MRLLLLPILLTTCLGPNLLAQDENDFVPGNYMLQAFEDINLKLSVYVPNQADFGWRHELCLAGAVLDLGETIALDLYLKADVDYIFVGGGDEDVTVLDAYLVSSAGEVLASDVMDDRTPIVSYTPTADGMYSLRLQLVGCEAPISFLGVALLQSGGGTYDEAAFTTVTEKLIASSDNVHALSTGVAYHGTDNQWSTFGFFLEPGQESSVENLNLATDYSSQWMVAASQDVLTNTDLFLLDDNQNRLDGDDASDNYPLFSNANLSEGQHYGLQAKAVAGTAPGLFVFSILSE